LLRNEGHDPERTGRIANYLLQTSKITTARETRKFPWQVEKLAARMAAFLERPSNVLGCEVRGGHPAKRAGSKMVLPEAVGDPESL